MSVLERAPEVFVWSIATIGLYWIAKQIYRRRPRIWVMPIAVTPLLLITLIVCLHETTISAEQAGSLRCLARPPSRSRRRSMRSGPSSALTGRSSLSALSPDRSLQWRRHTDSRRCFSSIRPCA